MVEWWDDFSSTIVLEDQKGAVEVNRRFAFLDDPDLIYHEGKYFLPKDDTKEVWVIADVSKYNLSNYKIHNTLGITYDSPDVDTTEIPSSAESALASEGALRDSDGGSGIRED